MRPTPRVDAAAERGSDLGMANMTWSGIWPLARTLERELGEAVEALEALQPILWNDGPLVAAYKDVEKQVDAVIARAKGEA